MASSKNNIILKYIIFQDTNDFNEMQSFINLCADLGIDKIHISFDFREINANTVCASTVYAAAYLTTEAAKRNISVDSFFINSRYREKINQISCELQKIS